MGLDISSASEHTYHFSYSGIHHVRWLGYKSIGGTLDFGSWHQQQAMGGPEYEKTLDRFPNLLWHSDCDGSYTLDGEVEPFDSTKLYTGNSKGLLEELQFIKDNLKHKNDHEWREFDALYAITKDVVENHDGGLWFQ